VANVKVRYIGTKPIRGDNICGTLAVWTGEGSVQAVPEDVAVRLCQFPDVWQLADKPVIKRPAVQAAPAECDYLDDDEPEAAPDQADGTPVTAAEIVAILPLLDKDTDFTEAGRPIMASVRAQFEGRPVEIADVKEAWATFTGAE
jgi:hypothetical protein